MGGRRAGRRRIGHVPCVHHVESGEVVGVGVGVGVGVEDRRLHRVGQGGTSRVEHGVQVAERLLGLGLDARRDFCCRRVDPRHA